MVAARRVQNGGEGAVGGMLFPALDGSEPKTTQGAVRARRMGGGAHRGLAGLGEQGRAFGAALLLVQRLCTDVGTGDLGSIDSAGVGQGRGSRCRRGSRLDYSFTSDERRAVSHLHGL
eukprot:5367912-Prymnesium_polylepis.1